jgi:GNAT superfamily N-acetyltransferase
VGTVSVVPKGLSLYIRGMAVLPLARGQQIGELLLTHIEKFAATGTFRRQASEHHAFFGSRDSTLRTFWFSANR